MSRKKQTPGLMGSPEYWPDTLPEWVEIGARSILRSPSKDPAALNFSDMLSLTGGGFGDYNYVALLYDLQEAGFPKYPSVVTATECNRIAARFTGAAPSIDDPEDLRASYAWVLAQLSALERARQHHMSENDMFGVWATGLRVGRLVEWWVWRHEGHDRRAAGKARSERKLPKARKARAQNQAWDADWHDEARQDARELHAKNSKRSRWDIAGELGKKYERSQKQVSKVIKSVVP